MKMGDTQGMHSSPRGSFELQFTGHLQQRTSFRSDKMKGKDFGPLGVTACGRADKSQKKAPW